MVKRIPSFFLLVPGPWSEAGRVLEVLAQAGIEAASADSGPIEPGQVRVEVVHHGDGFGQALAYGRKGRLPEEVVSRAASCRSAALLELGMRLDEDPRRVAKLGRALRDAGGVAVRHEGSGGASPWEPWIDQLESARPHGLYASAVVVVGDGSETFTCGMQQFDLPDAELPDAASPEMIEWLETFCLYQLAEQPVLGTGHTFAPRAGAPRRKIERWPDHRHPPSDGRHNPFGLWRILPQGDSGLETLDPVPMLIPSLVAVLLAEERAKGRPLSKGELEQLVDKCPAIAMPLSDVRVLERSRGYADLEPRRAWEQWSLVRPFYAPAR